MSLPIVEKHRSYKNVLYSYYGEECTLYTHVPSSRGVIQHHNRLRVPCAICKGKINSSFVRCLFFLFLWMMCSSEECLMYFHPGCVLDQYYSSSPTLTLQFAPRLTVLSSFSFLISRDEGIPFWYHVQIILPLLSLIFLGTEVFHQLVRFHNLYHVLLL